MAQSDKKTRRKELRLSGSDARVLKTLAKVGLMNESDVVRCLIPSMLMVTALREYHRLMHTTLDGLPTMVPFSIYQVWTDHVAMNMMRSMTADRMHPIDAGSQLGGGGFNLDNAAALFVAFAKAQRGEDDYGFVPDPLCDASSEKKLYRVAHKGKEIRFPET